MSFTHPFLKQGTGFLKISFFHRLSSNGINQILTFAIRGICLFLRNTSCSSYDHHRILYRIHRIHNPKGIKVMTRLRLGLSHLRKHKFKHSFQDFINTLCNCGYEVEFTVHFFDYCPLYFTLRTLRYVYLALYVI